MVRKKATLRHRAGFFNKIKADISDRSRSFLSRRPHRSFRLTKRRDLVRSLAMPGYLAFTSEVNRLFKQHWKTFALLVLVYALLTGSLVSIASQEIYATLSETLRDTGSDIFAGNFGQIGQAGLLFVAIATGSINQQLGDTQALYAVIFGLLIWLSTVWLLRNYVAGKQVTLRDGLYSAGAPILPTFVIFLIMLVQLLPISLALIGYQAAVSTGFLNGGVEAMLFWVVACLLGLISIYWITSTFIASVVVTLPGMYPLQAIKIAGDLVIGRRLRILLRLLWMITVVIIFWAVILIPVIVIDTYLKSVWTQITMLPIVPILLLFLSSTTVVWSAGYVYLLYRKIVDDDAKPAYN